MSDSVPSCPTLVTGATGFVGSAVARAFAARGHRLRLLVRPASDRRLIEGLGEPVVGDLRDPASLAAAVQGCRYVIHVAADYRLWVPKPGPDDARRTSTAPRALLRAARDAGVERIVYCSSVAALGLVGDGTPGTEATEVHPEQIVGVYKQSKYRAEQAVLDLVRTESVPAVIVNPSTPVGPRDIKRRPPARWCWTRRPDGCRPTSIPG